MPTPRLKGRALDLALRAAHTSAGAAVMRRLAYADYKMGALLALRPDQLAPMEHEPRPIAGGQPRMWDDAQLAAAAAPPGRTSGLQLRAAFAAGQTTPSEILEEIFRRIDAGELGAVTFSPYVTLDREAATRAAADATRRYAKGAPRGPLDGVPVPVKDEVDFAGLPTYGGTAWKDEIHAADGFAAAALRRAGAVLYGKTHTTEWGMSPVGINPHWDMPRNAYDPDRAPGGSSSGTGAAIALGHAPVGLGSDGGGSIRIPACLQGVFGIKPTFGRIGRGGDVFGTGTVSALGPLGATVPDLVDLLGVAAARRDPSDYACAYAPSGNPLPAWERACGRGVKGARIGVLHAELADADPRVAALCLDALRGLERDGARLVDVTLPHGGPIPQAAGVLTIGPESAVSTRDFDAAHGHEYGGELRLMFAILGSVSSQEYLIAQRARAALRRTTAGVLSQVDLLALPTLPIVAPRYSVGENRQHVADDEATRLLCRYTFLANMTGLPAGTAPVGLVDGLPAGLQLIGDAWDEASVLAGLAHCARSGISSIPLPAAHRPLL